LLLRQTGRTNTRAHRIPIAERSEPPSPSGPDPVTHFLDILRLLNQVQQLRSTTSATEKERRGNSQTRGKEIDHDRRHARSQQKLSRLRRATPPRDNTTEITCLRVRRSTRPRHTALTPSSTNNRARSIQPTGQPPSHQSWLLFPGTTARILCDSLAPSTLRFASGTGLRPLTALRESQIRRVGSGDASSLHAEGEAEAPACP
jgi:hypothetical protein